MPILRATCPLCELPADLSPDEVTLHLRRGEDGPAGRYGFACPGCTVFVVRPAGPEVVRRLLAGDVVLATGTTAPWDDAADGGVVLVEAGPHPDGVRPDAAPPLSPRDLVTFLEQLRDDDGLARWLAG